MMSRRKRTKPEFFSPGAEEEKEKDRPQKRSRRKRFPAIASPPQKRRARAGRSPRSSEKRPARSAHRPSKSGERRSPRKSSKRETLHHRVVQAKSRKPRRPPKSFEDKIETLRGHLETSQFPNMENADFNLPQEDIDNGMVIKLGFLPAPSRLFDLPHELVAAKLTAEKPPKFQTITTNHFAAGVRRWSPANEDEYERCLCKETYFKKTLARRKKNKVNGQGSRTIGLGACTSPRKSGTAACGGHGQSNDASDSEDETVDGCGENCLNRLLQLECNPANCSYAAEEKCQNQCFSRRQYAKLKPKKMEMKGWGLLVQEPVNAGQFLYEYTGEVITPEVCSERMRKELQRIKQDRNRLRQLVLQAHKKGGRVSAKEMKAKPMNFYFLTLSEDMILDACHKGSIARFINHSCLPNCEVRKWTVNGKLRVGIFVKEDDLEAGVEATIDYRYDDIKDLRGQPCFCGEAVCAKFIGGKKKALPSEQKSKKKKRKDRGRKIPHVISSDCFCSICGDGGTLVMCDGLHNGGRCPRCFHEKCLSDMASGALFISCSDDEGDESGAHMLMEQDDAGPTLQTDQSSTLSKTDTTNTDSTDTTNTDTTNTDTTDTTDNTDNTDNTDTTDTTANTTDNTTDDTADHTDTTDNTDHTSKSAIDVRVRLERSGQERGNVSEGLETEDKSVEKHNVGKQGGGSMVGANVTAVAVVQSPVENGLVLATTGMKDPEDRKKDQVGGALDQNAGEHGDEVTHGHADGASNGSGLRFRHKTRKGKKMSKKQRALEDPRPVYHGRWVCPYHFCDSCGSTATVFCRYCADSYCTGCSHEENIKFPGSLKPLSQYEPSARCRYVACSTCQTHPLNPDRTVEELTQLTREKAQRRSRSSTSATSLGVSLRRLKELEDKFSGLQGAVARRKIKSIADELGLKETTVKRWWEQHTAKSTD